MKSKLLQGTIILTAAGILTRLIGFGYRILLVNSLGETTLGVYQLVFPVYSICFTLYAAGIQTAVSQLISHEKESRHLSILKSGFLLSLAVSCTLSVLLYFFAGKVSTVFLGTPETIPLLRILALIFPFCGITSIANGYFYGVSNAQAPALSQIIEQLFRVGFVCVCGYLMLHGKLTAELAVMGLVVGELAANLYNMSRLASCVNIKKLFFCKCEFRRLLQLTLPLSGNKLVISLLSSIESVLIPAMLIRYGCGRADALAIFGILTGIVMPFITFPGTITNSLSVLLLPAISHAAGNERHDSIKKTAETAIHYSLLLGIFTASVFIIYGQSLGMTLFQNENTGKLLTLLSVICPFLYTSTTLTSVINGLGQTGVTFLNTVTGLSVRILFLVLLTPRFGIYAYLLGLVLSQILICLLNGLYVSHKIRLNYHLIQNVIWPLIFFLSILVVTKKLVNSLPPFLSEAVGLSVSAIIILIYLIKSKQVSIENFRK